MGSSNTDTHRLINALQKLLNKIMRKHFPIKTYQWVQICCAVSPSPSLSFSPFLFFPLFRWLIASLLYVACCWRPWVSSKRAAHNFEQISWAVVQVIKWRIPCKTVLKGSTFKLFKSLYILLCKNHSCIYLNNPYFLHISLKLYTHFT